MKYALKSISKTSIAGATSKAELYRNLNEPGEAESICRDILAIEPENQVALRLLGLAITDQFTGGPSDRYGEAESTFSSLTDHYECLYYTGLLHERRAKAQLRKGRWSDVLLDLFGEAMRCFEEAEMTTRYSAGTAACGCSKVVLALSRRPKRKRKSRRC